MQLTPLQQSWLDGEHGKTRRAAISLLADVGDAVGAKRLIPVSACHISGVSYLTGGEGLLRFLDDLSDSSLNQDDREVRVPSTLNPCGYDLRQREEMKIKDQFAEKQLSILDAYRRLGVLLTYSCTPYEAGNPVPMGTTISWAESSAIAYANSILGARTNRESGLTALCAALTGFTPEYGLHLDENRRPNVRIKVGPGFNEQTDLSFLGDHVGRALKKYQFPYGPIPFVEGLDHLDHFDLKAFVASMATYNCALAHIQGVTPEAGRFGEGAYSVELHYSSDDLRHWYSENAPDRVPDLIVIGCPQASLREVRRTAKLLDGKKIRDDVEFWVFSSRANNAIVEASGMREIIEKAGGLLVSDTCPEVVPYNNDLFKTILTNSLKAAHYIPSRLNRTPAFVSNIEDCVEVATTGRLPITRAEKASTPVRGTLKNQERDLSGSDGPRPQSISGLGLNSQGDFVVEGEALVTTEPITLLGFVDRETGKIAEEGHPLDGEPIGGKVFVYPTGTGSTVAPYVLLELIYRAKAPLAILNQELDLGTLAACSVKNLPFAYSFDHDPSRQFESGDRIRVEVSGGRASATRQ